MNPSCGRDWTEVWERDAFRRKEMLLKYLENAMRRAHYEILKEDGTIYAEIPGFQGR